MRQELGTAWGRDGGRQGPSSLGLTAIGPKGVQASQRPPELTPLSPKAEGHPQRWTACQGAGKWQVKLTVLLKLPQDKDPNLQGET